MKRTLLVVGVLILLAVSFLGVAIARDSYVISEYSGASQHGGMVIIDHSSEWKSAPRNPEIVYVAVWAPKPYKGYIEDALVDTIRSHGLKPIPVGNISKYDLKGRVVIAYFPMTGEGGGILSEERYVSGILYYSYAGDAKSAVQTIERGLIFSEDKIANSADRLCQTSGKRLSSMRIANQSCAVAYWWNLKAKVGKMKDENPHEMIANEIASQFEQILKSDDSNKS